MVKLLIDIDKNEHELYDVVVSTPEGIVFVDDNYTSEAAAENAGRAAFEKWRTSRS